MNRNIQQGFTLIELIMVIVILGILAATALPKFANLGQDARIAALKGLQGAINSAVTVTTAAYLIKPGATVTLSDGTQPTVNAKGFPTADAAGIGTAVTMSSDYAVTYSGTGDTATAVYKMNSSATCTFTYTQGTGATTNFTTSGC